MLCLFWAGWANRWCVCNGVCLDSKRSFVSDAVWDCDITLMSKCTTTTMTASCSCLLNVRHGVVFVLKQQSVSLWHCVLPLIWTGYSCPMQYEVVISSWCAVQMHNKTAMTARCRVGPRRPGRTCGIIGVHLKLKMLIVLTTVWSCHRPYLLFNDTTMSMAIVCFRSWNVVTLRLRD